MNRIQSSNIQQLLTSPMSKRVDQAIVEKWASMFWQSMPKKEKKGEPFVMMFPPPNITGNLHLGHALTATVQDSLIRQKRMQGRDSIWIPGFDHAGLATQNIVENLLRQTRGKTRQELGRAKFLELALEWKELKQGEMKIQLDRLGLDLDYQREYFTMDASSSLAVQNAFKQLHIKGLIYRAVKPVFWSDLLQTTLSDIEVENVDGSYRYIRTGECVERRPISQWFVDMRSMASESVNVVEKNLIKMIPPNYKRSWSSWLIDNGVKDWCISRQSWWGHRIPAYKLESEADVQESWVIADSLEEARGLLGHSGQVVQDPDVLDTWFSSSLLPLTVSGWPCPDKFAESCRKGLFPLHIMETGFDILTYWVSKMVMISLSLEGSIPFKSVLLHGMICDSEGKKMSKSKGNVIDPLDMIDGTDLESLQERSINLSRQGIINEKQLNETLKNQKKLFPSGIPSCGADGLRAYLLSHDIQEEVVRIQIMQIEKVRRLSNKIWNIYRFVFHLLECPSSPDISINIGPDDLDEPKLCESDRVMLENLSLCVQSAHKSFNHTYQLHRCFKDLDLFWTVQLSANCITGIKSILRDSNVEVERRHLKIQVMIVCLITSTKLLHPFMPHLTEFLYQKLSYALSRGDSKSEKICYKGLGYEVFPNLDEWRKFLPSKTIDTSLTI